MHWTTWFHNIIWKICIISWILISWCPKLFFRDRVADSLPPKLDMPPWFTNKLQILRNFKINFYKSTKSRVNHSIFHDMWGLKLILIYLTIIAIPCSEFFQSTYNSVSWSNSNYPNHLNRGKCIFSPAITESSLLSALETITPTYSPGLDGFLECELKFWARTICKLILKLFICLSHHLFFLLSGEILLLFHSTKRVWRWMSRTIEESPNCLQFLKQLNAL